MISKIYQALVADPYIKAQTLGRIKYYEYPATGDVANPYIVIDPLGSPRPVEYGSNKRIAFEQEFQVDVWTRNRNLTKTIANKAGDLLWSASIAQSGIGPCDYDEGIFRDVRRYKVTVYKEEMDTL